MGWLRRKHEQRSANYSIADPALAEFLGLSGTTLAGINVSEYSALGLTAVYRAVSLISGTIASLPLKSYRTSSDGTREHVKSFLDDPAGPDSLTPFEWRELVLTHLLLHGNAFLLHVHNGGGALVGLKPLHPSCVQIEEAAVPGGRIFKVSLADGGQRELTSVDLTHIPALGTDGLRGLSPIQVARNAIGTGLAGDQAAARMFGNGMLLGGIVSSDEALTKEQAEEIKEGLKRKLAGSNNAGDIAVVNASLKFSPWTMSSEDAQFVESRAHQIEEVARIFGVPKVLLAQDGASTWGSGIAELNRGLAKYTLMAWTSRIEERLSRLLPAPRFVEFDYAGLLQGTPQEEIELLARQVEIGLLTLNEARALRNLPPVEERPATEQEQEIV